jgi:hypothetical protein
MYNFRLSISTLKKVKVFMIETDTNSHLNAFIFGSLTPLPSMTRVLQGRESHALRDWFYVFHNDYILYELFCAKRIPLYDMYYVARESPPPIACIRVHL